MACKKRYKHSLKLINDLWKRFNREYLCELQEQQMYNFRKYSDAEKLVPNDTVLKIMLLHRGINGRKV